MGNNKRKRKRNREPTEIEKKLKIGSVKNQNLKIRLKRQERKIRQAEKFQQDAEILNTEQGGFLEAENDMEKTYQVRQDEIRENVDMQTKKKIFELQLDQFGPYKAHYSRSGTHLLLHGQKGHVGVLDWKKLTLVNQFQLRDKIHDACFLHDHKLFATAQSDYAYIYDQHGTEIHCLNKHRNPLCLDFLPYHFLLVSATKHGILNYQDVSTGDVVVCHKTRKGAIKVMCQNPHNAVMCLGHKNGTISMWIPSMGKPAVSMLCHTGPVTGIAITNDGRYMATSGADGKLKIWDVRTMKMSHSYFSRAPAQCLKFSQKNVLAVGYGQRIQLWKDPAKKHRHCYMNHMIESSEIQSLNFCPYEDVLGIGHSNGFQSIVIPGSGDPQFDSLESNPYATDKSLNNQTVHKLLDKIQPEMIQLNPELVGKIYKNAPKVIDEEKMEPAKVKKMKEKKKARQKYKSKIKRKNYNVISRKEEKINSEIKEKERKRLQKVKNAERKFEGKAKSALDRFA